MGHDGSESEDDKELSSCVVIRGYGGGRDYGEEEFEITNDHALSSKALKQVKQIIEDLNS